MNRLRMIRKQHRISMTDLAKRLGVSKQMVSAWENGLKEIPDARKKQLSDLFGVPRSYFEEETATQTNRTSSSDWYVQGKKDQKLLEEKIHRTLEGPEYLNIKEQTEYINKRLLLYRRFNDVVTLLNSQKFTDKTGYYTRILEMLDGMISAMGGQINLYRDYETSANNEKGENVDSVRNMFNSLLSVWRITQTGFDSEHL